MTVVITRRPKQLIAHQGKFSVAESADYLLLDRQTLRNLFASRKGPASSRTITGRLRLSIEALDRWISEHATGPGGSHCYFPVGRVGVIEVVQFLKASDKFRDKTDKQTRDWLAAVRHGRADGPAWRTTLVPTYYIPEVLAWAKQCSISSTYTMQPLVAEVIVIGTEQ